MYYAVKCFEYGNPLNICNSGIKCDGNVGYFGISLMILSFVIVLLIYALICYSIFDDIIKSLLKKHNKIKTNNFEEIINFLSEMLKSSDLS